MTPGKHSSSIEKSLGEVAKGLCWAASVRFSCVAKLFEPWPHNQSRRVRSPPRETIDDFVHVSACASGTSLVPMPTRNVCNPLIYTCEVKHTALGTGSTTPGQNDECRCKHYAPVQCSRRKQRGPWRKRFPSWRKCWHWRKVQRSELRQTGT